VIGQATDAAASIATSGPRRRKHGRTTGTSAQHPSRGQRRLRGRTTWIPVPPDRPGRGQVREPRPRRRGLRSGTTCPQERRIQRPWRSGTTKRRQCDARRGIAKGTGDTIRQFAHLLAHLGDASWVTFAVGILALGILFMLDRVPRVLGGLVVLVGGLSSAQPSTRPPRRGHRREGRCRAAVGEHGKLGASNLWVLLPSAIGMTCPRRYWPR
jgi:hypothetical protein